MDVEMGEKVLFAGASPMDRSVALPERHLGLTTKETKKG